jgi:two-component system chemotaxis response regulator CheB
MADKIRVMLVDDSAVVRGLLDRALTADAMIEIVASAGNGEIAMTMLKKTAVDVIVLDVEMPFVNGIEALPELLKISPKARIIMSSTTTTENAEISLKALQLGASDYITKPGSKNTTEAEEFYRLLIKKIKALAPHVALPPTAHKFAGDTKADVAALLGAQSHGAGQSLPIIAPPSQPVRQTDQPIAAQALAIASSTGGPQALLHIFREFKSQRLGVPVFITQHMPANFTAILADHISKAAGLDCREAVDNEEVVAGRIYLAPGGYHMELKQVQGVNRIALNQNPPENFCRPSADPMLRSMAKIYRDKLLVVVLTGLGADGARGAAEVVESGGMVVAQDEATSVVYGMPKAVADAKLTSAVFPLNAIAPYLMRAVT